MIDLIPQERKCAFDVHSRKNAHIDCADFEWRELRVCVATQHTKVEMTGSKIDGRGS